MKLGLQIDFELRKSVATY